MAKVIIFDVDGTLLDTERVYMDAWRQAGPLFGYEISDNVLLKTRAVDRSVAVEVLKQNTAANFHMMQFLKSVYAFPKKSLQPPRLMN